MYGSTMSVLHSRDTIGCTQLHCCKITLQIEKLQQQVSQAVAGRRSAEAEALRRGATLKQLEHRLGELSSEKDVSKPFVHMPAAQNCLHKLHIGVPCCKAQTCQVTCFADPA